MSCNAHDRQQQDRRQHTPDRALSATDSLRLAGLDSLHEAHNRDSCHRTQTSCNTMMPLDSVRVYLEVTHDSHCHLSCLQQHVTLGNFLHHIDLHCQRLGQFASLCTAKSWGSLHDSALPKNWAACFILLPATQLSRQQAQSMHQDAELCHPFLCPTPR